VNRLVSNPLSQLTGIPSRAKKMQLISAHLLGIAYIRYVFRIEPVASMPLEEVIALSVPAVAHYPADCEPASGRVAADPCPFGAEQLPRRCELCAPAYR